MWDIAREDVYGMCHLINPIDIILSHALGWVFCYHVIKDNNVIHAVMAHKSRVPLKVRKIAKFDSISETVLNTCFAGGSVDNIFSDGMKV